MIEMVFVAIRHETGTVSRMQIVKSAPARMFGEAFALGSGFALSDDGKIWARDVTAEIIAAEIARAHLPAEAGKPTAWRIAKPEDFPTADSDFRAAWRDDGTQITVDIEVAREIKKDALRRDRAPLLEKLDVEYMRADEDGDSEKKLRVAKQKQILRDSPDDPAIAASKDLNDLRLVKL